MRIMPMLLMSAASAAACAGRGPALREPVGQTMVTSSPVKPDRHEDAAAQNTCKMDQLPLIEFDSASSKLGDEQKLELRRLAGCLAASPEITSIVLIGYTDVMGAVTANLVLGLERARAVMRQLIDEGVSPARIVVASAGELQRPSARWGLRAHRVEMLLARGGPARPDEAPIARGIDARGLMPPPQAESVSRGSPQRLMPPGRPPFVPGPPPRRFVPPPPQSR